MGIYVHYTRICFKGKHFWPNIKANVAFCLYIRNHATLTVLQCFLFTRYNNRIIAKIVKIAIIPIDNDIFRPYKTCRVTTDRALKNSSHHSNIGLLAATLYIPNWPKKRCVNLCEVKSMYCRSSE
jgi:hypothetical protein